MNWEAEESRRDGRDGDWGATQFIIHALQDVSDACVELHNCLIRCHLMIVRADSMHQEVARKPPARSHRILSNLETPICLDVLFTLFVNNSASESIRLFLATSTYFPPLSKIALANPAPWLRPSLAAFTIASDWTAVMSSLNNDNLILLTNLRRG
jgi:hypothetical protein